MIAELHDGRKLEFPDGTAPEVVQATVKRVVAERAAAGKASRAEGITTGLGDSVYGLGELAEYIPGVTAAQQGVGKLLGVNPNSMSEINAKREEEYEAGRKAAGREGFDVPRTLGNVINPINWLPAAASKIPSIINWLPAAASKIPSIVKLLPKGAPALQAPITAGQGIWRSAVEAGKYGGKLGAAGAAMQPTVHGEEGIDLAKEKVKQALMGYLAGAVTAGTITGTAKTGGKLVEVGKEFVDPWTKQGYKDIVPRTVLRDVGRENIGSVIAETQAAKPILSAQPLAGAPAGPMPASPITVAEAIQNAPLTSPARTAGSPLQALQEHAFQGAGGASKIGGDIRVQSQIAQEAHQKALDAATGPMRQQALERANLAGQVVPQLENKLGRAVDTINKGNQTLEVVGERASRAPKVGMPKDVAPDALKSAVEIHAPYTRPQLPSTASKTQDMLAEAVKNTKATMLMEKTNQAQSAITRANQEHTAALTKLSQLEEQGLRPLKTKPIVNRVDRMLETPEVKGNEDVQKVLSGVRDRLKEMADKHGIIDAKTLYEFKKANLNQVIDKVFSGRTVPASKEFQASMMARIKPVIDDAIEGAGGTGWKKYLEEYGKGAGKLAAEEESKKMMYKPLQKTIIEGVQSMARGEAASGPPLLNRYYAIAKFLPQWRAKMIEPRLDKYTAGIMSDAPAFGNMMEKYMGGEKSRQAIVEALTRKGMMTAPIAGMQAVIPRSEQREKPAPKPSQGILGLPDLPRPVRGQPYQPETEGDLAEKQRRVQMGLQPASSPEVAPPPGLIEAGLNLPKDKKLEVANSLQDYKHGNIDLPALKQEIRSAYKGHVAASQLDSVVNGIVGVMKKARQYAEAKVVSQP